VSPSRRTFRRRLEGATIAEVGRVGKRVVLTLDSDLRLVFEPRMTGLVLLADPPTQEHVRLTLDLEERAPGGTLIFWDRRGLGTLSLLTPAEFEARLGPAKLGPDALELTPELLAERLAPSRRKIKVALLDQKAVAGIGNIYASEALHAARVHPERPCTTLKTREWRALQGEIDRILTTAIQYEGSTLSDGTYRNALNAEGGYQNHFRVYDREGERCLRCRKKVFIQRIVLAQRATFFCQACQR
jgi:formamidopyrimidine-DNA glycosylase